MDSSLRCRVRGAQTRQRERQMVQKLEAELEHLTEMVSLNRSNYLCIQSTGLLPLLRSNPDLAKNKLQVQESFTAVLRMLWNCLQQTNTQHDGVSALVQEAVVRPPDGRLSLQRAQGLRALVTSRRSWTCCCKPLFVVYARCRALAGPARGVGGRESVRAAPCQAWCARRAHCGCDRSWQHRPAARAAVQHVNR